MKVVDHLKKQLHDCSLGVMSAEKLKRVEDLVGQIEEAWNNEEVYWWQRSQITWLNSGDKNKKFFHTSVIQRIQRNKLIRLKDVNGCWLEDRADINKSLSAFYQDLFQSEGYRDMDQVPSRLLLFHRPPCLPCPSIRVHPPISVAAMSIRVSDSGGPTLQTMSG
ncbi:hypothetical protein K1719_024615 [Acacia pycnantha]|nr:hypothetical protein K1719_024615 [Acacia pycnantha]